MSQRFYGSFPVYVRALDESGHPFKANSLVDNIGSGGLYMQLARPLPEGSPLFAMVQLTSGARIAARGTAVRVERRPHGLTGVAMRFSRTRMFPQHGSGALPDPAGTDK